jgi:hypothetical protein
VSNHQNAILPKYHPEEIKNKYFVQLKTLVVSLTILRPSAEMKPLSVSTIRITVVRCLIFGLAMSKHAGMEGRPGDVNLRTVQASALL